MKRVIQGLALAVMCMSMASCGLPGALARSAGRLVEGAGNLLMPPA